jgi:branched-chain amino acid transport system permease protein
VARGVGERGTMAGTESRGLGGRILETTLARHLLAAVIAAVALLLITVQASPYIDYNLAGIAIFTVAAAGLNLLTGVNGQLSLGHGALMAIGAYTTSLLLRHSPSLAAPAVVLAAIAASTVAGGVVGVAAARLHGPYLAGATLALAVALPQVAIRYSSIFGGDQGITVTAPAPPEWLGGDVPEERWIAWMALAAALLALILLANLLRSPIGRALKAVRDDEVAAQLAGIDVARTRILAFLVSAACAGLAGSLFAFWVGLTAPAGFSLSLSLQLLSAIVIGGLGSLAGAVWGSVVLVLLPVLAANLGAGLTSDVRNNLPLAVYGVVLVVAMLVFPRGVQGGLRDLWGRLRAASRARHRDASEETERFKEV